MHSIHFDPSGALPVLSTVGNGCVLEIAGEAFEGASCPLIQGLSLAQYCSFSHLAPRNKVYPLIWTPLRLYTMCVHGL